MGAGEQPAPPSVALKGGKRKESLVAFEGPELFGHFESALVLRAGRFNRSGTDGLADLRPGLVTRIRHPFTLTFAVLLACIVSVPPSPTGHRF